MRKFRFLVSCAFALIGASNSVAANIAINNPSFEADVQSGCGSTAYTFNDVPGWSFLNDAGVSTFEPCTGPGGQFPGGIPNGVNVVAVSGPNVFGGPSADLFQTLGTSLQANTTYTLAVWVGQRADDPISGYAVSLEANGVVLVSDSSLRPAPGTFLEDILTYNSGANPAELGQNLVIDLFGSGVSATGGGGQVDFDEVSLQATGVAAPEPGFLTPLGLLVLGLAAWVRGNKEI